MAAVQYCTPVQAVTPRGLALCQGPAGKSIYPRCSLAYAGAKVCTHVSTNILRSNSCVCVLRVAGLPLMQRGHHLSLIGTKAGALNLRYGAAPIKTKRRHFLPIFLMNIKDGGSSTAVAATTTTHKEKLLPIILFALPVIGSIFSAVFITLSGPARLQTFADLLAI